MTRATTAAPTPGRPAHARLHRIPLTPIDPPYDDDPRAATWVSSSLGNAGAAHINLALPDTASTLPLEPSTDLPRKPSQPVPPTPVPASHRPTPSTRTTPAARAVATVVVRAIVETMSGIRPATHLTAWMSPKAQTDLERLAAENVRRMRYTLRCLRVCEPREGVAEVAAVIARGERASALALRMEAFDGRWRITTLASPG